MKKFWLLFALWLGMVGMAQAAMTCVETSRIKGSLPGSWHFDITCTFDATPGTAVGAIPTTAPNGRSMSIMEIINQGLIVYNFSIIPGATGPTDNSDLQIADSSGVIIISASGNGLDVIDNATITSQIMGDGQNSDRYPKGNGLAWIPTVTNNAVNNSSFILGIDTLQP